MTDHLTYQQLESFAWQMHWPDVELCRQLGISVNTLRNYRGKGKAGKPVKIPRYVALAVLALSHDLGKLMPKP